jgi:hypothetical protein
MVAVNSENQRGQPNFQKGPVTSERGQYPTSQPEHMENKASGLNNPRSRGNGGGCFCVAATGKCPRLGRSEEYREYAEACLAMAQTIADEVARAMLVQMVRLWHRSADAPRERNRESWGIGQVLGA